MKLFTQIKLISLVLILLLSSIQLSAQQQNETINFDINMNLDDLADTSLVKTELLFADILDLNKLLYIYLDNPNLKSDEKANKRQGKKILKMFVETYKSYVENEFPSLVEELIKDYDERFTLQELQELKRFYNTPLGQKVKEMEHIKISKTYFSKRKIDIELEKNLDAAENLTFKGSQKKSK